MLKISNKKQIASLLERRAAVLDLMYVRYNPNIGRRSFGAKGPSIVLGHAPGLIGSVSQHGLNLSEPSSFGSYSPDSFNVRLPLEPDEMHVNSIENHLCVRKSVFHDRHHVLGDVWITDQRNVKAAFGQEILKIEDTYQVDAEIPDRLFII